MSLELTMLALVLAAVSGLPGLLLARTSTRGPRLAAACMLVSALLGVTGAAMGLFADSGPTLRVPWHALGGASVGMDALSAFFLVPIFLMGGLGSVYGLTYWTPRRHPASARRVHLFWGLLVAGLSLLVISRHAMAFLMGWEIMALSAFFLVTAEDHREEARQAGLVYLIATHVGTLLLFALFLGWRAQTGSFLLQPLEAATRLPLGVLHVLFLLALGAFGLKAGIMPLHFWLPGAHANAPSHVSAVLSGVVLKVGIYGLVRWLSLFPDPPAAWGTLLLVLGAISGLLGVVFALGQHDLKRLLAYHSVENIGIILMGLGVAMLGRSAARPDWVVLGLAGALLHVWNHAAFKSLLFFGAGSVLHHTHTRRLDDLGGLAAVMPWTAGFFLLGAVAICGLPPLNGFVSEWFVFQGLLHSVIAEEGGGVVAVLAVPALAMIGALALACFVKVYGAVFLGQPRTPAARACRPESLGTMRGPMLVLAVCCVGLGLVPSWLGQALDHAIAVAVPEGALTLPRLAALAPLASVRHLAVALLASLVLLAGMMAWRGRRVRRSVTWDCGYALPGARMQYTAASFASPLVVLFAWVLRPHGRPLRVRGLFPAPAAFHSHVDEGVLDRVLLPAGDALTRGAAWCHRFQQGLTQHYVLYLLITVVVLLLLQMPLREAVEHWFAL